MKSVLISSSDHMFGRAIWDKLPKYIFENFKIARVKRGQFQIIQKSRGRFIPKNLAFIVIPNICNSCKDTLH